MITKEQFAKEHNIDIKYLNGELYEGDLHFEDVPEIPDGCHFNVDGALFLNSVPTIPDNTIFHVTDLLDLSSLEVLQESVIITGNSALDLSSLPELTHARTFNTEGYVDLQSAVRIAANTIFNVGGDLFLNELVEMPEGVVMNVEDTLKVYSLEKIPPNMTFNVGGSLESDSLTCLPEGTVFNVGCILELHGLIEIPTNVKYNVCDYISLEYEDYCRQGNCTHVITDDGHIVAMGLLAKLVSQDGNIYRVQDINSEEVIFLLSSDDKTKWAYGDTLEEAKENLLFERGYKTNEDYRDYTLDTSMTFADAIEMYRVISCENNIESIKDFVEQHKIDKNKTYTLQEVLTLTDRDECSGMLQQFFDNLIPQ